MCKQCHRLLYVLMTIRVIVACKTSSTKVTRKYCAMRKYLQSHFRWVSRKFCNFICPTLLRHRSRQRQLPRLSRPFMSANIRHDLNRRLISLYQAKCKPRASRPPRPVAPGAEAGVLIAVDQRKFPAFRMAASRKGSRTGGRPRTGRRWSFAISRSSRRKSAV